jgi:hypothetical protein
MTIRSVIKRKSNEQVVAITPIHKRDADLFLDQLMTDFDRLNFDVVWHINGIEVNGDQFQRIADWGRTVGYTYQDDINCPFIDQDRNRAVQMALGLGSPWISPHDADETLEPNAPALLQEILKTDWHWVVQWYNVWDVKDGVPIIRVDNGYIGYKARFYPTKDHQWYYQVGTASLRERNGHWGHRGDSGLRILHWGFQNEESRQWHFKRWDGTNGSHYWLGLVNELDKVQLKPFDPNVPHEVFVTC